MYKFNSLIIKLFYFIVNPFLIIYNSIGINIDSSNILSMSKSIFEVNFYPYYPQFYPLLIANYLTISNINILYVGVVLGTFFTYLISNVIKFRFSEFESFLFIVFINSYFYYSFALWFLIVTPFQLLILYFFSLLIIIYDIRQNSKFKFYIFFSISVIWGCFISIQMMPMILMGVILILFTNKLLNVYDILNLLIIITLSIFLSFILILFRHPDSDQSLFFLLKNYVYRYVFLNSKNSYFDILYIKNFEMFNFDNNLKIFIFIISLIVIYIFIFENIFYSEQFNKLIINFSLYFIVITYTGIFELPIISGRGQYFLLFLFALILPRFINFKLPIKSSKLINYLFVFLNLVNIFVLVFQPIKLK